MLTNPLPISPTLSILAAIHRYSLRDELGWLESRGEWAGLSAIRRVESIRQVGDLPATAEYRYFLCSITDQELFAQPLDNRESAALGLDVQFREVGNRSR